MAKDAAERLYTWSLQHKEDALPGVFLEYVTDSTRPPLLRVTAAYGLAGAGHGLDPGGKPDDHGKHREYHRGRKRQARCEDWVLGVFPCGAPNYRYDVDSGMGLVTVDQIDCRLSGSMVELTSDFTY